jgi:hypothetical protein
MSEEYNPHASEARWAADGRGRADLDRAARPFYSLMEFPYPSSEPVGRSMSTGPHLSSISPYPALMNSVWWVGRPHIRLFSSQWYAGTLRQELTQVAQYKLRPAL